MSPSAESSSALSDYTSAQFNTILIYLSASNFNWIFNSFQHSNWCFFSAYVHFNLIQCLHLNWNLQHFNCHYRFSFFHFYFIQSMSTISKRTTTNFHVWTLLPKHIGCGSYHVFMFCLSFLTSSAPVIHTLTHKHTHIFTAAHSSFLAAVQHYGEKLNLNADICHMHLAADVEVTPMFWRHFFFFHSWTKPSYREFPSCEWTSGRRGSAKSDWWLGSVCLLLLFIHVFILPVVIPSDPASPHPFLPLPQVPTRKHCLVTSGVIRTHPNPLFEVVCP